MVRFRGIVLSLCTALLPIVALAADRNQSVGGEVPAVAGAMGAVRCGVMQRSDPVVQPIGEVELADAEPSDYGRGATAPCAAPGTV